MLKHIDVGEPSGRSVYKFGGTSNATGESTNLCMEQGTGLVLVTSAPGSLSDGQVEAYYKSLGHADVDPDIFRMKVTDQLLSARKAWLEDDEKYTSFVRSVQARYGWNVTDLQGRRSTGLHFGELSASEWVRAIPTRIAEACRQGYDATSMLGEYLQAEVYEAMGLQLLDPAKSRDQLLLRRPDGWRQSFGALDQRTRHVLPGNVLFDGKHLLTASRGGSDSTAGCMAAAVDADFLYIMSDTMGMSGDPRVLGDRARPVPYFTKEMTRLLLGSGFVHPETVVPLVGKRTIVRAGNTFGSGGGFTEYTNEPVSMVPGKPVALSLLPEVAISNVYRPGMAETVGDVEKIARALARHGINLFDTYGTGGDYQTVLVAHGAANPAEQAIQDSLGDGVRIDVSPASIITIVGRELRGRPELDIHNLLAQVGIGIEEKDGEFAGSVWLPSSPDSLRFSAPPEKGQLALKVAHRLLIEEDIK